jgi:hypothetical protein
MPHFSAEIDIIAKSVITPGIARKPLFSHCGPARAGAGGEVIKIDASQKAAAINTQRSQWKSQ